MDDSHFPTCFYLPHNMLRRRKLTLWFRKQSHFCVKRLVFIGMQLIKEGGKGVHALTWSKLRIFLKLCRMHVSRDRQNCWGWNSGKKTPTRHKSYIRIMTSNTVNLSLRIHLKDTSETFLWVLSRKLLWVNFGKISRRSTNRFYFRHICADIYNKLFQHSL